MSRCGSALSLEDNGCPQYHIYSPTGSLQVEEDVELSNSTMDDIDPIQMKPQRISVSLRPGESKNMDVQFKQARDYPVDLYYLMDLSKSMQDDKESLALLGNELATKMRNLTNNFRLGFGSFVDKVVMPYVNTVPEK